MEGAVVSYAEGVAKALVGKLGLLLSEEYKLLRGVRGEVVLLRDDVAIMNSLLRMLAETDDGEVNHFVREWMKQLRELAYDAEDCIDLFLRRISYVRQGATYRHLFLTLHARHRLSRAITDIRARALAISERRARYGVDSQALPRSPYLALSTVVTSSAIAPGACHDPGHQIVGINDQINMLSDEVKSKDGGEEELKVFAIVGFGGIGKTTLAMEVYRRLEVEFVCQAKVSVSQAFDASKDMRRLLKEILRQVMMVKRDKQKDMREEESVGDLSSLDVERLTSRLREFLADKRYLVVIDDVWTINAWGTIQARLPKNNHGSRVIVTTRIETVAKACIPANAWADQIYKVKALESKDSGNLLDNRVFGPKNACPKDLETAKNGILKKCGGLPLAIVSIAGLLASYTSPGSLDMWNKVCNSIGSQMESNPTLEGMRQLITLSYNHLPHHLKACMMYLSIFPEDHAIKKGRLVKRWIAEGLIPEKRGLTSLEVADEFLDELVSRNMIKPASVSYEDGAVREYRVHDMMLEVIVSKALEENFVSLVGGQCEGTSYDKFRRLSIHGNGPRSFQERGMPCVRSLTTFRPQGNREMLDQLPRFTLLRVLDLEDCKDLRDRDMKDVCRLFLLRYLNLQGTDITVMPSEIGELQHLQTLWLYNTLLEGIPNSVIKLENLVHLGLSNRQRWRVLLRLPQGPKKMKSLYELHRLELREGDAELAREIGDLSQLRVLGVYLNCSNCSANQLLRHITIGGKIGKLPGWVEANKNLVYVQFWWIDLHSDDIYGVLCKLPNQLKITLERRCCKDEELVARTAFKFRVLKELAFIPNGDEPKPRVLRFEEGTMERLEILTMKFGAFRRSLAGLENLTSLREVKIHGKRNNRALQAAGEQLKAESDRRSSKALRAAGNQVTTGSSSWKESNQIKVILKYD